jgi:peroxiredoxin
MRYSIILSLFVALIFVVIGSGSGIASQSDIDAAILGKLDFQAPDSPADRSYLGLANKPLFRLADLKGKFILLELFSMYCPICQAEAPVVNSAFKLLNDKPELASKVRMLGIGAGNTPFEVEVYRKKYQVPFPLVPDDKMAFRQAYHEEIRTPTFILVRIDERGEASVLFRHIGRIKDPALYVDAVVKAMDGR